MKQMVIALALFAVPSASAAQTASDLCTNLKQVIASATETPSFGSMTGPDNSGTWTPQGMIGCAVSRYTTAGLDDGYSCLGESLTEVAATSELSNLHEALTQCLGVQGARPDLMNLAGEGHLVYQVSPRVAVFASRRGAGATHRVSLGVEAAK